MMFARVYSGHLNEYEPAPGRHQLVCKAAIDLQVHQ